MKYLRVLLACVAILFMAACNRAFGEEFFDVVHSQAPSTGHIHLYGERHSREDMTNKHFDLWSYYYNTHGMRHMVLEIPFFTAEFLTIWMHEDSDDIFEAVFSALRGTAADTEYKREFFRRVKRELPETVFHGVDIGHQYGTTGARFLQHLRENGLEDSELYRLAAENVEQGRVFYAQRRPDHNWRTVVMANNFIRVFDSLGGESVMGQFGGFHVNTPETRINPMTTRNMIAVLKERYGENVHTTCLVEYFEQQAP